MKAGMKGDIACPLGTERTEVLLEYSTGRMDAPAELERHVKLCPDCASFLAGQAAVWRALDLWEPAPVSVDFNRRLWQRIEADGARRWYHRLGESLLFKGWKPAIPLTAALLVMAAGFLLDHKTGGLAAVDRGVVTGTVSGVSVREADQIEQTLDDIQLLHQLDAEPQAKAASKAL